MTERQEVAKKLRAKYKERTMPGLFEPQDVYFYTLNYLKDLEKCLPDGESAFTVLADLIDPTCEGIYRREPDDIDGTPRYTIHCSNCGQLLDETSGIPHSPMYCHNCGTRIIRGRLYSQSEDSSEVVKD